MKSKINKQAQRKTKLVKEHHRTKHVRPIHQVCNIEQNKVTQEIEFKE